MNKNSRTTNTFFNFIGNIAYQFAIIILAFVTRRVFIGTLGPEYLGINGLFNNILTVLSLAELGVGNAIYFSMYKQIAKGDKAKLIALTTYYKSLYNKIAVAALLFGLAIMPFLRLIVNLENEMPNLELYYFISLLSSVTSYLFVYKTSIVSADQSEYKIKWLNIVIQICKAVIGIIVLKVLKNYLIYISLEVVLGILGNFICSKYAE